MPSCKGPLNEQEPVYVFLPLSEKSQLTCKDVHALSHGRLSEEKSLLMGKHRLAAFVSLGNICYSWAQPGSQLGERRTSRSTGTQMLFLVCSLHSGRSKCCVLSPGLTQELLVAEEYLKTLVLGRQPAEHQHSLLTASSVWI